MHTFKAISFVLLVEYFLNDNWHKLHCLAEEEVPDYLKLVARKKDSLSTSLRPTGAYKVSEQIQNIMKPLWNAHWKWLAEQEKQNASNHSSRSITDKKYLTSNIPTGMEDCKNRNIMESFHREACGIPKDTSVDITKSPDVLHVIPKSITVKRCGGECQNSKMSCVPIEAEKISVPVIELRFNTERGIFDQHCGMAYVEKHIRCRCECTLKPSNCSNKQMRPRQRT
ncbi:uncharacterized protein LOC143244021 isoform X2 [Tachypleus tridentatus]|uniref:uncharacterized protein LOC143244021 isoform X2 n=1 Tax=Tachypleus tridentatus TaxID=6853 RepID=UPI003FD4540C